MSGSRETEFVLHQIVVSEGWPLADFECTHGRMAHDRPVRCECFDLTSALLAQVHDRVAAQAAGDEETMRTECKEVGCAESPSQQFGRYAGYCHAHGAGRNGNGVTALAELEPELEPEVERLVDEPVALGSPLIAAARSLELAKSEFEHAKQSLERALHEMNDQLREYAA